MEESILLNKKLGYHSVNFDIFKVISILENGIYSKNYAEGKGINISRNYLGYNGNDYISLAESPSISNTYQEGAFDTFIKRGISFVIDTTNYEVKRDNGEVRGMIVPLSSGVKGEVYIKDHIKKEDIKGLMLKEEILNTEISSIDIGLLYVQKDLINIYALNFLKNIVTTFNYPANLEDLEHLLSDLNKLIEVSRVKFRDQETKIKIEQKIKEINNFLVVNLSKAIELKYNVSFPTIGFILEKINKNNLPIYNIDGQKIEFDSIKK